MAYLKPPFLATAVLNRLARALGLAGTETVTVRGRRSGALRHVAAIPVTFGMSNYLVSSRGESEWVRNLRVNPEVVVKNKAGTHTYSVVEVAVDQREPIIAAYRAKAGKMVDSYWRQLPNPVDHPVFELIPAKLT